MTKNTYTAQFKAKVSLEALKEDQSIPEIFQKYDLHPSVVNRWKKEAISGLSVVFEQAKPVDKTEENRKLEMMERKIGQLSLEYDFLKKSSIIKQRGAH